MRALLLCGLVMGAAGALHLCTQTIHYKKPPDVKDGATIYKDGCIACHGSTGNRLLPAGFDKATAEKDIAVIGAAADDSNFNDKGSLVRYVVSTGNATGPFRVQAELWYQPVGFRWAHNLAPYMHRSHSAWCATTKKLLESPLSF